MHFTEPTTQTRANANSILFCIFKCSTLIGAVSVYEYIMEKEWIQSILSMNDRNAKTDFDMKRSREFGCFVYLHDAESILTLLIELV